ncbi:MAG TPA: glycosyltransferase family A protein [Patescibacteria group bacterium]|nr:glycosyltransferase family A protein [Patescibacteria group bacterium]
MPILPPGTHTIATPHSIEAALYTAVDTGNALLGDYCTDYAQAEGIGLPGVLVAANDELQVGANSGQHLRWLDTVVSGAEVVPPSQLLLQKIQRTLGQISGIRSGELGIMYVAVPALNEEANLTSLIASFQRQDADVPIAVVVGDNNSVDGTTAVTQKLGGNVVAAPVPGIGPTRQAVVDFIIDHCETDLACAVIAQTDADCEAEAGYARAVSSAFAEYPNVMVGVGPSVYEIKTEGGTLLRLSDAKGYGDLLGTTGLRGYFDLAERDIADYLLEPPYRYLAGPNTAYRASLFRDHDIRYPSGREWESICVSVQVQRRLPSATAIRYIPGQVMNVSPRAIVGAERGVLTQERLGAIRATGHVGVFSGEGSIAPLDTTLSVIRAVDRETYGLGTDEQVVAVLDEDSAVSDGDVRPALHGATGSLIPGKVAVIGKI